MKYVKYIFILLLMATVVRLLHSESHWFLEIVTHLPIQFGIAFVLVSIIFFKKREITLGILSLFLAAINLSALINLKYPSTTIATDPFELYIANIFHDNPLYPKVLSDLHDYDADIVFLSEVTREAHTSLKDYIQDYEFRVEDPSSGTEGFIFLSQFPIQDHQIIRISDQGKRPIFIAELLIHDVLVTFYGVHAHNPVSVGQFSERKNQFNWLAQHIAENPNPIILAGDLNLTPYSPIFQNLSEVARLKDSRSGFGWQPTWPSMLPIFWIPIDHVLLSSEFQVHDRQVGSFIGSDHYPVVTSISTTPILPEE